MMTWFNSLSNTNKTILVVALLTVVGVGYYFHADLTGLFKIFGFAN